MKDAKGHGSDSRGAHAAGIEQATQPSFLNVTQGAGHDRNWYVQHAASKTWVGSLSFKSAKEGQAFVAQHLDPTNTYWRDAPNLMSNVYRRAVEARNK